MKCLQRLSLTILFVAIGFVAVSAQIRIDGSGGDTSENCPAPTETSDITFTIFADGVVSPDTTVTRGQVVSYSSPFVDAVLCISNKKLYGETRVYVPKGGTCQFTVGNGVKKGKSDIQVRTNNKNAMCGQILDGQLLGTTDGPDVGP